MDTVELDGMFEFFRVDIENRTNHTVATVKFFGERLLLQVTEEFFGLLQGVKGSSLLKRRVITIDLLNLSQVFRLAIIIRSLGLECEVQVKLLGGQVLGVVEERVANGLETLQVFDEMLRHMNHTGTLLKVEDIIGFNFLNGTDFVKFSFDEVEVAVLEIIVCLLAVDERIAFDILIVFAVYLVLIFEQHIEVVLFIIKLLVLETVPIHIHN